MIPDINRKNQKLYYKKDNEEWVELNTTKPIELVCLDDAKEYVESLPHEISSEFSFHVTRKSMYRIKKALGLIKAMYKKKKKGKRYVKYEII